MLANTAVSKRKNISSTFGLIIVLMALVAIGTWYIQKAPLNYDEGTYLMFGQLAEIGYQPYEELFVTIPPFGVLTIQGGIRIFGAGPGVRTFFLYYSVIAGASLFWLVKRQAIIHPRWSGVLAIALLLFYPNYFFSTTKVMLEVPAMAIALLSVALMDRYRDNLWNGWIFLSGLAFGFSLALKLFVVFVPLLVVLQFLVIVSDHVDRSWYDRRTLITLLVHSLIWIAPVLIVAGIVFLIYPPEGLYEQLISFRVAARDSRMPDNSWLLDNARKILEEFGDYWPLFIGAFIGLWAIGRRNLDRYWIWLAWFVLAVCVLITYAPLRSHHMLLILPPLAALTGIGVTHLPHRLNWPAGWFSPVIALGLIGLILGGIWFDLISLPSEDDFIPGSGRLSAVEFIRQMTAADDCVVTDDARVALLATRPVPPQLSETSHTRIGSGWLSTADVLQAVSENSCPILVMGPRFSNLPDLTKAVEPKYSLKLLFADVDGSSTITVYFGQRNSVKQPGRVLNKPLGGKVLLKGIETTPLPWYSGKNVSITTYWQAQQPIEQDYKIFVHLKDGNGAVLSTFDHYPFGLNQPYQTTLIRPNPAYLIGQDIGNVPGYPNAGLLPTRLWLPGETLQETINITVPPDIQAGSYSLEIGMYEEATLERLTVQDPEDGDGSSSVLIENLTILHDRYEK